MWDAHSLKNFSHLYRQKILALLAGKYFETAQDTLDPLMLALPVRVEAKLHP